MAEYSQEDPILRKPFEDILDNISDPETLFTVFWDYLNKAFSVGWGCSYWYNPVQEEWLKKYVHSADDRDDFPKKIAEDHPIIQKLIDNQYLYTSGMCREDAGNRIELSEFPEGFKDSIMVIFGTELNAPALVVLGNKSDASLYDQNDIDGVCKAVKSSFRTYERIEITSQLIAADKNVTVSEVAAGIAHEINNNITPIIGRAQLLQKFLENAGESELNEKVTANVNIIYNQSCKIARIAQNLTRLSQPMKIEFDVVDLKLELNDAVEIMAETAGKIKHFKRDDPTSPYILKLDFTENEPPIRGDAQQLEQVFINLIINAAHAIEAKGRGTLTVGTRLGDNDSVIAFIKDTGIGMNASTMEKMWKPFFTTKKKGKGTGLGMAIVKNVIKAHGAEIQVESKPGAGTEFQLIFPAFRA